MVSICQFEDKFAYLRFGYAIIWGEKNDFFFKNFFFSDTNCQFIAFKANCLALPGIFIRIFFKYFVHYIVFLQLGHFCRRFNKPRVLNSCIQNSIFFKQGRICSLKLLAQSVK